MTSPVVRKELKSDLGSLCWPALWYLPSAEVRGAVCPVSPVQVNESVSDLLQQNAVHVFSLTGFTQQGVWSEDGQMDESRAEQPTALTESRPEQPNNFFGFQLQMETEFEMRIPIVPHLQESDLKFQNVAGIGEICLAGNKSHVDSLASFILLNGMENFTMGSKFIC